MELINQVATHSQALRLEELGVNQDTSYALWTFLHCRHTKLGFIPPETHLMAREHTPAVMNADCCAAFTVAELGVMLGIDLMPTYHSRTSSWASPYEIPLYATEAQARAAQLIHLLETGVFTTDEVNARL